MCHEPGASPPFHDAPVTSATAERITLVSADGTPFPAFTARPRESSGLGVLVLPDNRGLSGFYESLSIQLAEQGHAAVAVDYYARTAGIDYRERGASFGDLATLMPRHLAKLTRAGLFGDFAAGIEHLRAGLGCRTVVSLGFCIGGRYAFTTALPRFGLAGVAGFHGFPGRLGAEPGPTEPAVPVLAFWGGGDAGIAPEAVAEFEGALAAAGVPHDFVTYPGAPHGFFDERLPEFADASADAWSKVLDFLAARL